MAVRLWWWQGCHVGNRVVWDWRDDGKTVVVGKIYDVYLAVKIMVVVKVLW